MRTSSTWKRRALRAVVAAFVIAGCTLGGTALALLAGTTQVQQTAFGTIQSSVRPDLEGHVSVYVPLVDWRVHLLDHDAPATVQLELRAIDRDRAGAGISSARAANRSLQEVRRDAERVVQRAVRRGVQASLLGGVLGGLVGGAILSAVLLQRRWLVVSPLFAAAVLALVLVPSVRSMRDLGAQHIEVTAAGGHARELPTVLRFAEQLLDVGDEYEAHYETALRSISNLAEFAGSDRPKGEWSAILVSDLHDNVFVLDALDEFAGDTTTFAAGDFIQVGARVEERTAPQVARLGGRLVAVSGNHDTPEYMASLREEGATVLDSAEPLETVQGLRVAGYPDPLERDERSRGEHRLRVYGAAYEQQVTDFIAWWESLPERPDVVLVHQHGFAHRLREHLEATGDEAPLLLLTGHDHRAHVHGSGPHVIVDGGTIGAGGLAAIGEQEATFARLEFAGGRATAVDLVAIEPLTGRASSRRIELSGSD